MPMSVEKAFGNRREQRRAPMCGLAFGIGLGAMRAVECDAGGISKSSARAGERAHGQQHAFHIRIVDDGVAALLAVARVKPSPAAWRVRQSLPLQSHSQAARFIMVNIAAMPLCSSPMRKPTAPLLSPYTMVQVGEAWMPILCSTEWRAHVIAAAKAIRLCSAGIFGNNINPLRARAGLPDAPAGTKGISLFLVPKFLLNKDGSLSGPQ